MRIWKLKKKIPAPLIKHLKVEIFFFSRFHYSKDFSLDDEVKRGLVATIERMYPDHVTRFNIENQLEKFKRAKGSFGTEMAIYSRDKKQPGMNKA